VFHLRRLFSTYCFLLLANILFAQKQTNNWYFGLRSGLDFNQSPPRPLHTDGTANSAEGTASISDNNGKLLFYTNGQVIVNRMQLKMKNGNSLSGSQSSTNNTVIVPLTGNDSIYYVFTTGAAEQETHQFLYNIINMKGDGGLGEVTGLNLFIEDAIFEKVAAIRHCNNRDVWIVVHKWSSDEYHSYLVTATGLNPVPVISHTGLVIGGKEKNEIGYLKFSSKGNKLAAVHAFDNDNVELMDFDNTTGMLSNPVVFQANLTPRQSSYTGVYGAEFSPNGKLLYISATNSLAQPCLLYQFDISSNNAAAIVASGQIISNNGPWFAGALQMGPDLKIYMAMWRDTSLSVIEDPDVYGPGCNFSYNKIFMGPPMTDPVQFGLPNFIQSYFDTTSIPYDFTRDGNCINASVAFKINRLNGIDSVKWDFGDGQKSKLMQPVNTYAAPGFYDVQLVIHTKNCSGLNDTVTKKIWIAAAAAFLGKDISSCDGLSLVLGIDEVDGANYIWSTGAVTSKITTTSSGLYWLEMEQNGCKQRDSITIFTKPKPIVSIGNDTTICPSKPVVFRSSNVTADSYLWNTGETTKSILVSKEGKYYVTVTENGCIASDTALVVPGDCDIFIPNAFTPNRDGKNDYFGVLGNMIVTHFSFQVYNRYGQVIFSTTDISGKWDGTYRSKQVPNGAYPWVLTYTNGKGLIKWLKGTVLIAH
jgi:gliding motility-associated-like protein